MKEVKNKKNSKSELKESKDVIFKELNNIKDTLKKDFDRKKEEISNNAKKEYKNIKKNIKKEASKVTTKINDIHKQIEKNISKNDSNNKNKNQVSFKFASFIKFIIDKINMIIKYIKKLNKKTKIILLIVLISIIFIFPFFFNKNKQYNYDYEYIDELVIKYKVKLNIDFEENWIFSKYGIDISTTGEYESLEHGEDKIIEFNLKEGEHVITFESDEDSSISKEVPINVTSNMEIGFKINCHSDKIVVTKKYTDKDEELISSEIKINTDKSSYVGGNYKDVIKKLEKLGFTNIEEKPMYDIELGWTDEGEVDNVKINGKDNYKRGDIFNNNDKVVVSYHMNANDDPSKIKVPYNSDSADGKDYKEVEKAFKDAGFTNIKSSAVSNHTYSKENTVSHIYADGEYLTKDKYKPNTEIEIMYYGNPLDYDSKESDELSSYYAKKAFEEYGESKYRYGFKCHWWKNLISFDQSEDGKTWFIKVGVTIENAYGNKYEAIAEGIVTGNDYSHKVTSFYVN